MKVTKGRWMSGGWIDDECEDRRRSVHGKHMCSTASASPYQAKANREEEDNDSGSSTLRGDQAKGLADGRVMMGLALVSP